jgi:hypothetical protein
MGSVNSTFFSEDGAGVFAGLDAEDTFVVLFGGVLGRSKAPASCAFMFV